MNINTETKATRQLPAFLSCYDNYLQDIAHLLINPKTLPYFDSLDWQITAPAPPLLLRNLTNTRLQHLKLVQESVIRNYEVKPPSARNVFPLRSLILSMSARFDLVKTDITTKQGVSILRQCAPTLEVLKWEDLCGDLDMERDPLPIETLRFPKLRVLNIVRFPYTDGSIIRDFLQSPLDVLVVDASPRCTECVENCLLERGYIPSLRTFVCEAYHPGPAIFDFLEANPQISRLSFIYWLSETIINQKLLPMLSFSFDRLKSLSISWEQSKKSVDDTALELISTLKSLEQVHFLAGSQRGLQHDWLIDHNNMRHWLARLPKLRKFAFSRDSYQSLNPRFQATKYVGTYYKDRRPDLRYSGGSFEAHDQGERYQIWEEQHRGRIIIEAQKYVEVLPKLEWMYFGQLPMRVVGDSREVVTSAERASCCTLLKKMFGCEL